jgi:hypothetical protein
MQPGAATGIGVGAEVAVIIGTIKMQLALASPRARSALAAIPIVLAGVSNPVDMAKAAVAWGHVKHQLGTVGETFDTFLPKDDDWEGAGRAEFNEAMIRFKDEWSQMQDAAGTLSAAMWEILAAFITFYIGLVTLWFAINAYLTALMPALVPPTTGFAVTAMEGAGITGVASTAAAAATMKGALTALGIAVAGAFVATLTGLMQADTNDGSSANDFVDIKIKYPTIVTP